MPRLDERVGNLVEFAVCLLSIEASRVDLASLYQERIPAFLASGRNGGNFLGCACFFRKQCLEVCQFSLRIVSDTEFAKFCYGLRFSHCEVKMF